MAGTSPAMTMNLAAVMPGRVPGIHVLCFTLAAEVVDGRDKPGHDDERILILRDGATRASSFVMRCLRSA